MKYDYLTIEEREQLTKNALYEAERNVFYHELLLAQNPNSAELQETVARLEAGYDALKLRLATKKSELQAEKAAAVLNVSSPIEGV